MIVRMYNNPRCLPMPMHSSPSNMKLMPILLPSGKLIGMWIKAKRSYLFFPFTNVHVCAVCVKSQWHTTSHITVGRLPLSLPWSIVRLFQFKFAPFTFRLLNADRKCDISFYIRHRGIYVWQCVMVWCLTMITMTMMIIRQLAIKV